MTSYDMTALRATMIDLRERRGARTPIGRRCSNIIELIDNLPRPPADWIEYLLPDTVREQWQAGQASLHQQASDIHQLLRARA